ncbi:UNVERIFIED_CONTAM: Polyadenylate-binding protein 8 [Sesamum calycinum]|uniref:Polyadenylate-binding protein 8 n=2 Tax=Sesamum TaxID=4181 RepID=A0AAW2QMX1_9LAMI
MAQIQVQHQNVAAAGPNGVAAPGGAAAGQFMSTSLYVGDLDLNVTDSQLYDLFNQVGQVVSVRVCRDLSTRRSLGYGYVNYSSPKMNLDKTIDNKALHDTFSSFGNILSCKIATDPNGQSKGYGFVQFDSEEAAQGAIDKLNGMLINDKQVYVGHFLRKQERETALHKTKFNNVYVKNLAESTTDDDLKKIFGEYGAITSSVVMRDADGKSKCFGFVNFENADDAAKAVEALNGKKVDDKEWYVGKAQKKSEREQELKNRFEQTAREAVDKFQGLNLYIKNLDDSIDDEKLKELFTEFGTITSCKVMRDPSGISRGSGFVAFSTPEEASRALSEMNGKMVVSKPLYVALAQRKEERRARLQAQFSQMRPVAMPPSMAPRMPMYPPGAPGIGQQLFYGQAPPAIIPQAGFGYQQQLVPGMRPGGAPMPNFFVPLVQQGQQGQRPGGRRGGGPVQQNQQPVPMMQQQMLPRGRMYRFPPGRNVPDVPIPGVAGGMLSVPYDMGGMLPRDAAIPQPMPITALASALANATPEQQRTAQFSQMRPVAMPPSMAPRMPMYPPGAPGIGQQLFYGQAPPAIIPQAGFGYQQQLVPGMRPGGAPMPNFFVPLVQQGQQGQRPGGRRGGGPVQQNQQPVPMMQQQVSCTLVFKYCVFLNLYSVKCADTWGCWGMLSVPYDMGGMLPRDAAIPQPMPITALASALANATPEQQRTMLGENLYPLVDQLEHEHAAKVTGMLLEMDQTEVLHLLESPEALKAKVAEAMDVLRNVQQANSPADQLASLSLNDNLVS